jgi:hypothetical protein
MSIAFVRYVNRPFKILTLRRVEGVVATAGSYMELGLPIFRLLIVLFWCWIRLLWLRLGTISVLQDALHGNSAVSSESD